jgi:hypothetical protein
MQESGHEWDRKRRQKPADAILDEHEEEVIHQALARARETEWVQDELGYAEQEQDSRRVS